MMVSQNISLFAIVAALILPPGTVWLSCTQWSKQAMSIN